MYGLMRYARHTQRERQRVLEACMYDILTVWFAHYYCCCGLQISETLLLSFSIVIITLCACVRVRVFGVGEISVFYLHFR